MAAITLRSTKGSPLSYTEMDDNFNNLNSQFAETIPANTQMLFYQASAPTGWSQVAVTADSMLRVVNVSTGTSGTQGGSVNLSSYFSGWSTELTTLTAAQSGLPSHTHDYTQSIAGTSNQVNDTGGSGIRTLSTTTSTTQSTGGTAALSGHDHSITFTPRYTDVIICKKDSLPS